MEFKKRKNINLLFFIMILAFACVLAGCGNTASEPSNEDKSEASSQKIEVIDMLEREISLDKPAERIVVLDAANCEILYALGADDKIVAVGEYCDYPKETSELDKIGSGRNTNIEAIVSLQPDIVIANSMDQSKEQINAIEEAGVKVILTHDSDISGVYEAVKLVGAVTGKSEEAEALTNDMKIKFAEIKEKAEKAKGSSNAKTVYFEASPIEYGLWASGKDTFVDEIASILGLENIFSDVSGWVEVSQEQVISRNPDYIISTTMYFGEGETPTEEIYNRRGWENISALKADNVYNADSDAITRPGPRLIDAAEEIYNYVYGE